MASLRPGKCYHDVDPKAYTRTSKRTPRKSYIKGAPDSIIKHFETGNKHGNFSERLTLRVNKDVQLRHNVLEAARTSANKHISEKLGKKNYFIKVLVFPHHVLRENPIATGAGADRFQEGMTKAFGRPTAGRAARVKKNQRIMFIEFNKGKEKLVKEALRRAGHKLPCSFKID